MARRSVVLEAAVVGGGGAALGALAGRPFGPGFSIAGALVGGANGALSGVRALYDWRRASGWAGALLDSTWGLIGTAGGLGVHALSRDAVYLPELSIRRGHHVYQRGWAPRRGFAFTAGNVITGAGDPTSERRRQLVERHEGLHVWQQRFFGPFFPLLYGGWMAGGAVTGAIAWSRTRAEPLFHVVERHAYYYNPFERWAYVADENWPPRRMQRSSRPGRDLVEVGDGRDEL